MARRQKPLPNDAVREVLDYVHSTEWGADLK
jgi:hypothetical protein